MEDDKCSDPLVLFVNGKKIVETQPDPEWTLLYYLRYKLKLCGTKEGCSEGGCGACTVMISRRNTSTGKVSNLAVNACLTPLCSVHESAVVTVEGIGSLRDGLHPVQERIAKSHGSQCGFCTPGFVMSMYALLRSNPVPNPAEMETAFQGNLCRCTGYRPILQGFQTFCNPNACCRMKNGQQMNGCCRENGIGLGSGQNGYQDIALSLHDESEFKPYDPSQDPIFPPELQLGTSDTKGILKFQSPNVTWFRPTNFKELLNLKEKYPEAKILAGNTEIGVDVKFKKMCFPRYIHVSEDIGELKTIKEEEQGVFFGSAVTLAELESFCSQRSELVFKSIASILHWFGGQQIRNVATIGGNLVTASPISDLNPIFVASDATAILISKTRGTREVRINQEFFTGYRSTVIAIDEILTAIYIPKLSSPREFFWAAKQARRKDDDIAIVNAAIKVKLAPNSNECTDAILVYGGMAAKTKVAVEASKFLINKTLTPEVVDQVLKILSEEMHLPPDVPGGMATYRVSLVQNFFFKFYLNFTKWNSEMSESGGSSTEQEDHVTNHEIRASQLYQIVPENQHVEDLVGRPVVHVAGLKHATGEAIYVDDTPITENELFGAFVLSTRPCGKLKCVDGTKALGLDGVVAIFSAKDIPADKNVFGVIMKDENVFAIDEVSCCGQVIAFVVAKTQQLADKGADLVRVEYEQTVESPILTIEEAIARKSFLSEQKLLQGDFENSFVRSELKVEGEVRIGGQEHFYMETQSCISYPGEDDEIDCLLATQSPSYMQGCISFCLGLPAHKIRVKCRRMGGGFGGKETRTAVLAIVTSLAAKKLRRPIRCVLNRVEDMKFSGFRHPFLSRYQVGFQKNGKIDAVKVELYANAGISFDLSGPVMNRAVMSIDSGYNILNWHIAGTLCKTNLPSNTAFRGFGGPQASFLIETIMDHVAVYLGRPTSEIQAMHLYQDGDTTPYDYVLDLCTVKNCWSECLSSCDFYRRKKCTEEFNRKNRWKKRGIAVLPTKHVIGFTESFLNQAGALILVYRDGSVSLNHGGTEMGQGLHTKMIQIASRVLGISADKIYFSESSTDKVPNTSSTAGSLSSDLNGPAVINACSKIVTRLKPYKEANPKGTWEDWVNSAYFDRVSLSATGFYSMDVGFDLNTKQGKPCNYITYGVGCSEVEIDCLTGDHTVIRTDIVMDVGESLNPAVDIGQIEGGFVQGYGLFTLEELLFSPHGHLLTKGPGMYKIPSVADIPKDFNVSLLRGAPNPRAVYSSKAVGEPPLFLGASVFFAIKEAIRSSREDKNLGTQFRLDAPATAERILLACQEINSTDIVSNDRFLGKPNWSVIV